MTKREQYQIQFQKQVTPQNRIYHFASTANLQYADIASHLTDSNIVYTNAQIDAITKEEQNASPDFFWGEVRGSAVYFYNNGTIEIGDVGTILTQQDFKQLLQDWLALIS